MKEQTFWAIRHKETGEWLAWNQGAVLYSTKKQAINDLSEQPHWFARQNWEPVKVKLMEVKK